MAPCTTPTWKQRNARGWYPDPKFARGLGVPRQLRSTHSDPEAGSAARRVSRIVPGTGIANAGSVARLAGSGSLWGGTGGSASGRLLREASRLAECR
jgi:hypothetical protein